MERLTERDKYGNSDLIGVDSEDLYTHLGFTELNRVTDALNKLADYEDAEAEGRLIRVVQCKDCIYRRTEECPVLVYLRTELDSHDTDDDDFCSFGEASQTRRRRKHNENDDA